MPGVGSAERQFSSSGEGYPDDPLTRSVRLMAEERGRLGYVTEASRSMILDEELTPVLEVLVDQKEAFGIVPRTFRVEGDDLIDPHGQSVKKVTEDGVEFTRRQVAKNTPGAWRELRRRTSESRNVGKIAQMPAGSICIEVSANPIDWAADEKEAQHYTGLTMIRASIKTFDRPELVDQFNFVLPNLDTTEAILALQEKLGLETGGEVDTQELLDNPKIVECHDTAEGAAREIGGLAGAVLLEKSVGHSTVRMIQRAIDRRREGWRFITSQNHLDVHTELLDCIERLSLQDVSEWVEGMAAVRTGFTREFKDRFVGRHKAELASGILLAAASRAVAAGDVYIACGSTIIATEISRTSMINSLRTEITGSGDCSVCGRAGLLYGCGLCFEHNQLWCDRFALYNEQTEISNLAHLSHTRPVSTWQKAVEEFGQDWARVRMEVEYKQRLERQRQAKAA